MKIRRNSSISAADGNSVWLQIMSSQVGGLLQEYITQDRLRCAVALEAEGHFAAAVVVMKSRERWAA
jgi:hypothetical protein